MLVGSFGGGSSSIWWGSEVSEISSERKKSWVSCADYNQRYSRFGLGVWIMISRT